MKNYINNLVNFRGSSRKYEHLHFDQILLSKAYKDLDEKKEELCFMALKSDAKFEERLTLASKNDMRNLANFNASSGKSENLHFDVLLFSPAFEVSAKKCRRIISHDTEE